MADNIPFEIQLEIIKRLPVKSLIKLRSVSKTWKSSIDSPDFIARCTSKVQHLLVKYQRYAPFELKYVSFVDDDTFPQHKDSPFVPELVKTVGCSQIVGNCRGLLCLYYNDGYTPVKAVIWNVSIRKAVGVVVPNDGGAMYITTMGFGVCNETNDPKIVKINHIRRSSNIKNVRSIPWQVEIFTLSTGVWRSPNSNLPRKSIEFHGYLVMVDEFLYWHATDKITMDRSYNLIISFNITTEEFKEVKLPDTLAHNRPAEHDGLENLCISKIRNSLVVLECDGDRRNNESFIVWMMEDTNSESFAKLFTISKPNASIHSVLEFKNNGELIIEIEERHGDSRNDCSLVVYEPYSKQIKNNLEIDVSDCYVSMASYGETLLLIDQPDSIVYNKGKSFILKPSANTNTRRTTWD